MLLFFKHIPQDTLNREIVSFVTPVIRGGLLGAKGKVTKIDVIALKDKVNHMVEFHALVNIEPDNVAMKVIKKLDGQVLKERAIAISKYTLRSWQNDKRREDRQIQNRITEKRVNQQRRRNLEVITRESPEYSSYDSLYRQL
jgi:hypothetical protein